MLTANRYRPPAASWIPSTTQTCRSQQLSRAGLQITIESLNYQLRKVTKARGSFPSDAAAMKLLYLAIRNINQKRGSTDGTATWGWTRALNTFAIQFPDRLPL